MTIATTHTSYTGEVKEGQSCICLDCCKEVEAKKCSDVEGCADFPHFISWIGCPRCKEPVYHGKIFLDKKSRHVARKDAGDIKKGQTYIAHIIKGYYISEGKRYGIFNYTKKAVI